MILDGKYLLLKRNQYHQIFPMLYKMGYVWPTHFLDYDLSGIDFLYKRFEFLSITTYDDNKTLSVYSDWTCNSTKFINKEEFNIGKFLRENKLKRILK